MSTDKNRRLFRQRVFALKRKSTALRSEEEVVRLHARSNECCHQPARDEAYLSRTGVDANGEEHQLGSAVQGTGGMGTDGTTFVERVRQSSFHAALVRLLVHLSSSYSIACLGDTRTAEKVLMFLCVGARTSGERDISSNKDTGKLNFEAGLVSEISGFGERIAGVRYPRAQVVPLNQWYGSTRLNARSLLPI